MLLLSLGAEIADVEIEECAARFGHSHFLPSLTYLGPVFKRPGVAGAVLQTVL